MLAKYLYQTGQKLLDPANSMSCGLTISMFQDFVEILAAAVAIHMDAPVTDTMVFAKYWEVVPKGRKNSAQLELPMKAAMLSLRVRNKMIVVLL